MPSGPENSTVSEIVLLPEALIPNAANMEFVASLGTFPLILQDIVTFTSFDFLCLAPFAMLIIKYGLDNQFHLDIIPLSYTSKLSYSL